MKKPKLVKDWKQSWKWISMWCMTGTGIVQTTWLTIPDDIRAGSPGWLIPSLSLGLLVAGVFGRLLAQGDDE